MDRGEKIGFVEWLGKKRGAECLDLGERAFACSDAADKKNRDAVVYSP